jgi:uncharacterized membrane protein
MFGHDHGLQRVVQDLAGAAKDHPCGQGRRGPRPGARALAGMRSRHNTYMSVPLVWTMLNLHSALTEFATWQWVGLLEMIAIGWHIVFQLYRKSALVQGF